MNQRQKALHRLLTKSAALPTTGIRPGMTDQQKQDYLTSDRKAYGKTQPGILANTGAALRDGFGFGAADAPTFADAPDKSFSDRWSENRSILGGTAMKIPGAVADVVTGMGRGVLRTAQGAGESFAGARNNLADSGLNSASQAQFDNERQSIQRNLAGRGITGADLERQTNELHHARMKDLRDSGEWEDNRSTVASGLGRAWSGLTDKNLGGENSAQGWKEVRRGLRDVFRDRTLSGGLDALSGAGQSIMAGLSATPVGIGSQVVGAAGSLASRAGAVANMVASLPKSLISASRTGAGLVGLAPTAGWRGYAMANDGQQAVTNRDLSPTGLLMGAQDGTIGYDGRPLEVSPETAEAYTQNQDNALGPTGKPFDPASLVNILALLMPHLRGQQAQPNYDSAIDRAADNVRT